MREETQKYISIKGAKAFAAYSLYGWIEVWFQRGMKESAEEMAGLFRHLSPYLHMKFIRVCYNDNSQEEKRNADIIFGR